MNHTMLGARIAHHRARLGLSKSQLARDIGVSDVTISYWERGSIQRIGHYYILALAGRFEITVSELLDDPLLLQYTRQCQSQALRGFAEHCNTLADNARENGYSAQADAVEDMVNEALERATELEAPLPT